MMWKLIGGGIAIAVLLVIWNNRYQQGYDAAVADIKVQTDQAIELARVEGEEATRLANERADKLADDLEAEKRNIKTVVQTIEKEVPVYVSEETDNAYPVPVGWVRVHDTSASGGSITGDAVYPGLASDAAAPVRASESAVTVNRNYGLYHACVARVGALQQHISDLHTWYEDLRTTWATN